MRRLDQTSSLARAFHFTEISATMSRVINSFGLRLGIDDTFAWDDEDPRAASDRVHETSARPAFKSVSNQTPAPTGTRALGWNTSSTAGSRGITPLECA
jgi:hypothetical protein